MFLPTSVARLYDLFKGHQLHVLLLMRESSLLLACVFRVERGFEESKPSDSLQAKEDDPIILSRENKAKDKTTPALFSVICKVLEYEVTRGG